MGDEKEGAKKDAKKGVEPPAIPPWLPKDFGDFLQCKSDSITMGGDAAATNIEGVTASVVAGKEDGHVTIKVKGLKGKLPIEVPDPFELDLSVGKKGKLHLSAPDLPKAGKHEIHKFTDDFNAFITAKGKKLAPPETKDGKVVLAKVATTSAVPGGNGFFPHVPTWEKVGGTAVCLAAATFAFAGMNIGDSATTSTKTVAGAPSTPAGGEPAAPTEQPTPEIGTVVIRTDHGPEFEMPWTNPVTMKRVAGRSDVITCANVNGIPEGSAVIFHWTGDAGPFDAIGVVDPTGRVIAAGGIDSFGTYRITGAEALLVIDDPASKVPVDAPPELTQPYTVDASEDPCTTADVPAGDVTKPQAPSEPVDTPAVTTKEVTTTDHTDGFPWSLGVGAGIIAGVFGFGAVDEERRRREERDARVASAQAEVARLRTQVASYASALAEDPENRSLQSHLQRAEGELLNAEVDLRGLMPGEHDTGHYDDGHSFDWKEKPPAPKPTPDVM
jgi:hypothetical protein